jgi:hypothetical protein
LNQTESPENRLATVGRGKKQKFKRENIAQMNQPATAGRRER